MWPLSAGALTTLRSSHAIGIRCTAYTPDGNSLAIPVSAGSSTADSQSQVRRTATVTVGDPALWPAGSIDALSPLGTELYVEFGIVVPGKGTEWVPLIRGPIQSVKGSYPNTDALVVEVADRSKRVADDRMDAPTQTVAGATCVAEITRLITETIGDAVVIDETGSTMVCPQIDISKDRWADGVETIADALAAEVFADAAGIFHIRPAPTIDDDPVWLIDAGETGVLIKADLELTRDQVYNAVIVTGQRTDGTIPVWRKIIDNEPGSPTFYGGPFGKKPRYYASPLITTTEQADSAGAAMLARVRGYAATVTVQTIPNPALEPGDVVEVRLPDGSRQRHIIDKVPMSFSPADSQPLTTRSVDVPPAEG